METVVIRIVSNTLSNSTIPNITPLSHLPSVDNHKEPDNDNYGVLSLTTSLHLWSLALVWGFVFFSEGFGAYRESDTRFLTSGYFMNQFPPNP
jgi:hypothetical protein